MSVIVWPDDKVSVTLLPLSPARFSIVDVFTSKAAASFIPSSPAEKLRGAVNEFTPKMLFRIGINLGDVIEEEGRLYGDGVNIAAGLEVLPDTVLD